MRGIGSVSRRLRLGGAGVMLTAAGLSAAGCGGSEGGDRTATPAPSPPVTAPSVGASPSVGGTPAAGAAVDGERLFAGLTKAMISAGGCTMKATIGAVSLNGTFTLGKTDEMGFVSKVTAEGSLTSADDGKAGYRAQLGQRFQGAGFFVDDGQKISGRTWARVPRNTSQLKDPQGLVKAHPLYLLVAQAVPLVEPDNIPTLMSVRKGLVRAADSTAKVDHFIWTVNGEPPVAGAPGTYQLWTDDKGRPTRFVGDVRGAPLEATYADWGKHKVTAPPADDDTHALPTG